MREQAPTDAGPDDGRLEVQGEDFRDVDAGLCIAGRPRGDEAD